jgi:hypothetical protein
MVTDEPKSQGVQQEDARAAARTRTFLKGIVYYDSRRVSIDCTIRDLSDTGARIEFSSVVTVPDNVELHVPQKQITLLARVRRREKFEIGLSFEDQRSDDPRRAIDGDMAERVKKIEHELVVMKRQLKKLETKIFPNDTET